MGSCCPLFDSFSYDHGLPMAATVTAASVEAAAAVDRTTTANCAATTSCGAMEPTTNRYMRSAVVAANCAASDRAAVPAITTVPAIAAAVSRTPVSRTSVVAAVKPRACADEEATGEVARAVVAVRSAGVRVIPIVAVGADGSWSDISRADADADCKALGISVRRESQCGSKDCKDH